MVDNWPVVMLRSLGLVAYYMHRDLRIAWCSFWLEEFPGNLMNPFKEPFMCAVMGLAELLTRKHASLAKVILPLSELLCSWQLPEQHARKIYYTLNLQVHIS